MSAGFPHTPVVEVASPLRRVPTTPNRLVAREFAYNCALSIARDGGCGWLGWPPYTNADGIGQPDSGTWWNVIRGRRLQATVKPRSVVVALGESQSEEVAVRDGGSVPSMNKNGYRLRETTNVRVSVFGNEASAGTGGGTRAADEVERFIQIYRWRLKGNPTLSADSPLTLYGHPFGPGSVALKEMATGQGTTENVEVKGVFDPEDYLFIPRSVTQLESSQPENKPYAMTLNLDVIYDTKF